MRWIDPSVGLVVARVLLALGVGLFAGVGCERTPEAATMSEASYGRWDPASVARPENGRAMDRAAFTWSDEGILSVAESELAPYSVWRSRARTVRWFAGLPAAGRGGPTFLAYSSPTGIATLKIDGRVEGAQMRENWILVGFPGAENWTDWDSPWAVFCSDDRIRLCWEPMAWKPSSAGRPGISP